MAILLRVILWEGVNCNHKVILFQSCKGSLELCAIMSISHIRGDRLRQS